MLSYKHGYHAGNFADVLKHICWVGVVDYLNKKNKPYTLYDSHSGAGVYSLEDDKALKNKEFENGIGAINHASTENELFKKYLSLCDGFYCRNEYPGSPLMSVALKRDADTVHLFELDKGEFARLENNTRAADNVHVHNLDGWKGVKGLTPPKNQRGAVIIDPPYEQKQEYQQVFDLVRHITHCWRQAPIVIWYPKLSGRAGDKYQLSEKMVASLAQFNRPMFVSELCLEDETYDAGMYGTGICVVNPPWGLDSALDEIFSDVTSHFGAGASYHSEWLVES